MEIPPHFGWRLLADVSADLPGVGSRHPGSRPGGEAAESSTAAAPAIESGEFQDEALEEYEAFEDYEASGELAEWQELAGSPELTESEVLEAEDILMTAQLREAWAEFLCADRKMVTIPLLSNRTPVNPAAAGAFDALAEALTRTGYQARSAWVYNCRNIAQAPTGQPPRASLHAYGLAVDIDPEWNPHRHNVSGPVIFSAESSQTDRQREVAAGIAGTVFTPQQIAAVEAIRTVDGLRVFGWGGRWRSSHDAMHFEIRLTPAELARGLAAPAGEVASEAEAALADLTQMGDAAAEADELAGEFEDASAWEDAGGYSRWGLYDRLALGWGRAGEVGND
jgi:hypothetical protein